MQFEKFWAELTPEPPAHTISKTGAPLNVRLFGLLLPYVPVPVYSPVSTFTEVFRFDNVLPPCLTSKHSPMTLTSMDLCKALNS